MRFYTLFFCFLEITVSAQGPADSTRRFYTAGGRLQKSVMYFGEGAYTYGYDSLKRITYYSGFRVEADTIFTDTLFFYPVGNMTKKRHVVYKNGLLSSFYYEFSEDGNYRVKGNYAGGKRVGDWFFFNGDGYDLAHYENDVVTRSAVFCARTPDQWSYRTFAWLIGKDFISDTTYLMPGYEQKERRRVFRRNGVIDSFYVDRYQNSYARVEGLYKNGLRRGTWRWMDTSGVLLYEKFYPDTPLVITVRLTSPTHDKDDYHLMSPADTAYIELLHSEDMGMRGAGYYLLKMSAPDAEYRIVVDGKLMLKAFIIDHRREGTWTEYYSNGKVKSRGLYENGVKNGTEQGFYGNGRLYYINVYSGGLPTGVSTQYSESGAKYLEYYYEHGKLVREILYDKQGRPVKR